MMQRPITTILFFVFLIFYSCKKDDAVIDPEFGKVYFKKTIERVGKIRVFAKGGEVNNPATVSRLEEYSSSYITQYADDHIQNRQMDSITFFADRTAVLSSNYFAQIMDFSRNKDKIILTQKDTSDFHYYGDLYSNSILYQIGQYKSTIYSEELASSVGGNYLFRAKLKNQYVFSISGKKISAPQIAIVHYFPNGARVNIVNNDLSPTFSQKIPVNDTVVLQVFSVNYQ